MKQRRMHRLLFLCYRPCCLVMSWLLISSRARSGWIHRQRVDCVRVRDGAAIVIDRQRVDCARVGDGAAVVICSQDMVPCHVGRVVSSSRRVASCHLISSHVMSSQLMSCHVMSCHVRSGRVGSGRVGSCRIMSSLSCRVMSCHVASCPVVLRRAQGRAQTGTLPNEEARPDLNKQRMRSLCQGGILAEETLGFRSSCACFLCQ